MSISSLMGTELASRITAEPYSRCAATTTGFCAAAGARPGCGVGAYMLGDVPYIAQHVSAERILPAGMRCNPAAPGVNVPNPSGYPTGLNQFNLTTFGPVTTTRLRTSLTARSDADGAGVLVRPVRLERSARSPDCPWGRGRADGVPLSRLVVSAAESELRRRAGRQVVADWQAEHGAFTAEELAVARAEMAAADAQAFGVFRSAAA